MKKRARPSLAVLVAPLFAALALGACAAAAGPGWTYVPPAPTPVASAGASGAPASGTPAASGAASSPAMSGMPTGSGAPAASGGAGGGTAAGQTVTLDETAALQITDANGQQVTNINVKKGETVHFKITNTAGFTHNFYVGKVSDLEAANASALTGTGDFASGTKEFDYTFSDTSAPLGFGCIVPGHYQAGMKGTFTVQ